MSGSASPRVSLLAAAFLFSTGGTVIKLSQWSGVEVAAGRSLVAAVVLYAAMPGWRRIATPSALLVGTAYAATLTLFVLANKLTTAANAIFLQSTAPFWVLFLAPWILGERNRRSDVLLTSGLLLGLALFFVGSPAPVATAPDPVLGNLVGTTAGVAWAFTLVGLRFVARRSEGDASGDGAGAAVVAGNAIAFVACLPFLSGTPALGATDVGAVLYLGVVQVGLAYILMNRGIRRVPALEASLLLLVEPVLAAGIAAAVHGEWPDPWALTGCAVILAVTATRTGLAVRALPSPDGAP